MRMRLSEIGSCLHLPQRFPDCKVLGACTDHRECVAGDIFACIEGERVDGHDFVAAAVERGATAILAQKDLPHINVPVLKVNNTIKALGSLAGCWRSKSRAKVIGITGTAGKTTLKDTLASILSTRGSVALTEKNHNNQIGLPCSILRASGDEDWWIMELGISHAGDMEELGEILRPDLAVILNVAPGHTEGLGEKGVAWHKSRIFEYLTPEGVALASADYPDLVRECEKFPFNVNYFSINQVNTPWRLLERGQKGEYLFQLPEGRERFQTPFLGEFGAESALAAVALADILGFDAHSIQEGFNKSIMPEQRFNYKRLPGCLIINDTYNANPLSMRRMIQAAREEAGSGNLILVLGEMGELGEEASKRHYELGKTCAECTPAALFWHGKYGQDIVEGLKSGAFNLQKFHPVNNLDEFKESWQEAAYKITEERDRCVILFKGSRFNKMERFLDAFEKINQQASGGRDAV